MDDIIEKIRTEKVDLAARANLQILYLTKQVKRITKQLAYLDTLRTKEQSICLKNKWLLTYC